MSDPRPAAAVDRLPATLSEAEVLRLDPAEAATLMQTVEERRQSLDQMMWQVPVLSLTAQSFLLTIGLSASTRWAGRIVAAFLGLVAAVAAIQLLLKHRYHEEMTARWLERFAQVRGWPNIYDLDAAEAFAYRGRRHDWRRAGLGPWHGVRRSLTARRSPYVWISALALFGLGHLLVLAAGLAELAWNTDLLH